MCSNAKIFCCETYNRVERPKKPPYPKFQRNRLKNKRDISKTDHQPSMPWRASLMKADARSFFNHFCWNLEYRGFSGRSTRWWILQQKILALEHTYCTIVDFCHFWAQRSSVSIFLAENWDSEGLWDGLQPFFTQINPLIPIWMHFFLFYAISVPNLFSP